MSQSSKAIPIILLCTIEALPSLTEPERALKHTSQLHKTVPSTAYYSVLESMHKIRLYPSWQYCFVLHDLHKACPRTTLYYQPSTKYFPLLLCTAMQMLHKALASTCTPKLAQKHFHFIGARIIMWSVEQRVWSVECGRVCMKCQSSKCWQLL